MISIFTLMRKTKNMECWSKDSGIDTERLDTFCLCVTICLDYGYAKQTTAS